MSPHTKDPIPTLLRNFFNRFAMPKFKLGLVALVVLGSMAGCTTDEPANSNAAQDDLAISNVTDRAQGIAQLYLQNTSNSIQKCLSVLDSIEPGEALDGFLKEVESSIIKETFDASSTLEQLNQLAGMSTNLSAEDLNICAKIAHIQMTRTPEFSGLVGQCPGSQMPCYGTEPGSPACCTKDQACASECDDEGNCEPYCESSCFPSGAMVQLENGTSKAMRDLAIGDRVQVVEADGGISYEDVYLMTHNDAKKEGIYIEVTLASNQILKLSPRHFIPTERAGQNSWEDHVLIGANELVEGDVVWYLDENETMTASKVTALNSITDIGAYNPLTASGTIVVDGVVASVHSDWFLDGVVSAEVQGKVYQTLFLPVRAAYSMIGKDWTQKITEEWGIVDFLRERTLDPLGAFTMLLALSLMLMLPIFGTRFLIRSMRTRLSVNKNGK